MATLSDQYFPLAQTALTPYLNASRWIIAYSGGVDSRVLLAWTAHWLTHRDHPQLIALHINHCIAPQAHQWQKHCQHICQELSIPFIAKKVMLAGKVTEAALRHARYQIYKDNIKAGDCLLLAHHNDDQIETFFLRLFRGAGDNGLSGMPFSRPLGGGTLLRPFLTDDKSTIIACAHRWQLNWIEDHSNQDTHFQRNFLRHTLFPQIEKRWPAYRRVVQRTIGMIQAQRNNQVRMAEKDYHSVLNGEGIRLDRLAQWSAVRRAHLLRYWLAIKGYPPLSAAQLIEIDRQFLGTPADRQPIFSWNNSELRRYQNCLYLMPSLALPDQQHKYTWSGNSSLAIPGAGTLIAKTTKAINCTIRFRHQHNHACAHFSRHRLKNLLWEKKVPPWLRERIPLIFDAQRLVAIGDLWHDVQWTHKTGCSFVWYAPLPFPQKTVIKSERSPN